MKQLVTLFAALCVWAVGAYSQSTGADSIKILADRISALEANAKKLGSFSVSGYIQGQYQWGERDAALKVGSGNDADNESYSRIGVRRGRLKFGYLNANVNTVFQLDITEKGIGVKDAYVKFSHRSLQLAHLKVGIFGRPFGYEISNSSLHRESPERSTIFQTLFPDERDLGAMVSLRMPETSSLSIFKLDAGLFAGNGINRETDSRLDFIGRLGVAPNCNLIKVAGGVSYYYGTVYQGSARVLKMVDGSFSVSDDDANIGKYAKRQYFGVDGQLQFKTAMGTTKVVAEFIAGTQPGTEKSSKSPNSSTSPKSDTYIRNFSGGYVMVAQQIAGSPFHVVVKHDWYDPNTKVSGNNIGGNFTSSTDFKTYTTGVGILWNVSSDVRLTGYYDFVRNETSLNVPGMCCDLNDDVFTINLQYKF